jgi:transposase-like protein
MAEGQRMTAEEVVAKLMSDEHADFLRQSLRRMVEQLMEAEVSALIGAELGERTPDRATHRNGYRPRRWDTRAGEIELRDPEAQARQLLPELSRAPAAFRAGAPERRPAGLCLSAS